MGNWERQEERKRSNERRKEGKKRDGIQTAELDRRDQVTATNSWPSSLRKEGTEVDTQVAAPNESSTHLAPSDNRSTKSADGRVATEAAWLMGTICKRRNKDEERKKRQNERKDLTLTGLMEGVSKGDRAKA
jgi:hypothetical protein